MEHYEEGIHAMWEEVEGNKSEPVPQKQIKKNGKSLRSSITAQNALLKRNGELSHLTRK